MGCLYSSICLNTNEKGIHTGNKEVSRYEPILTEDLGEMCFFLPCEFCGIAEKDRKKKKNTINQGEKLARQDSGPLLFQSGS